MLAWDHDSHDDLHIQMCIPAIVIVIDSGSLGLETRVARDAPIRRFRIARPGRFGIVMQTLFAVAGQVRSGHWQPEVNYSAKI